MEGGREGRGGPQLVGGPKLEGVPKVEGSQDRQGFDRNWIFNIYYKHALCSFDVFIVSLGLYHVYVERIL